MPRHPEHYVLSGGKPSAHSTACELVQNGLSVVPTKGKSPASSWKDFQSRLPTEDELKDWFGDGIDSFNFGHNVNNVAVVAGKVSGGLEVLDFDDPALIKPWKEAVFSESPELLRKLPMVKTPSGGCHAYYRCEDIEGSQKLAVGSENKTLIETRGEGAIAVTVGSEGYKLKSTVPVHDAPVITPEERQLLLNAARQFSEVHTTGTIHGDERAGDKYNRETDWHSILDGWAVDHVSGGLTYWTRPGKDGKGWSATTGKYSKNGNELLCVFSSNAHLFEPGQSYTKFGAYALLNHGGDYAAAAKALGFTQETPEEPLPKFELIRSKDLFATEPKINYIIADALVEEQLGVVAAPMKGFKTTAICDAAINMATGGNFLGRFPVAKRRNVLLFSAESGRSKLRSTALRICQFYSIDPEDLDGCLTWSTDIPKLANSEDLKALERTLQGMDVVAVDPLYLAVGSRVNSL